MGTLFFLTLIRLSSLKNWKGKRDRRATERQSHHWHGFNSEPAPLKCTSRKSPGDIYRAGPNRESGLRQTFSRSAPPLPCRFLIATSFKMEISLREKTNTGKLAGKKKRGYMRQTFVPQGDHRHRQWETGVDMLNICLSCVFRLGLEGR